MVSNYQTPDVYFQSVDATRRGITAIRTDIAAFIGLAERGPLHTPHPIESWRQFQTIYGNFVSYGYLAYCVKAFFENGGARCYVIRVAATDAQVASGDLIGFDGLPTLTITASSPGRWGNQLEVRITNGALGSTQTLGYPNDVQPTDGSASAVVNSVAFPVGTLVRLFQTNASGTIESYRVVTQLEPIFRHLIWDHPLKLEPAYEGDPVFDVTKPIDLETVSFTLSVYENRRLIQMYPDLSLVPQSERYVVTVIQRDTTARIVVEDLHKGETPAQWKDWSPDITTETTQFKRGTLWLHCGTDGLTNLNVANFTGDVGSQVRTGLRTLEVESEVAIVAIPDIMIRPMPPVELAPLPEPEIDECVDPPLPPTPMPLPPDGCPDIAEQPPGFSDLDILSVQQALVQHCKGQADRFALLDPLPRTTASFQDHSRVLQWRQQFDTSFAALYDPWVLAIDPLQLGGQIVRAIPPSGHVAGVMARTDLTRGVHVAPANQIVQWAQAFSEPINDTWHGVLNTAHINALRCLQGRGCRVCGARTLSTDTHLRYVNVRRTLLMIEKALRLALEWTVFEPNEYDLRQSVSLTVAGFLHALWQRDVLVGASPEQAYFVRCDDENNPPADVAVGRLAVDIGVSIVHPAEFVIVRIGRTEDELTLIEVNGDTV